MGTAVKEVKKPKFFESKEITKILDKNENDAADLALAKSRRNGEFTSADEFISFLRK